MSNSLDITTNSKIYKIKPWRLALNVFSLIFLAILLGCPLTLLIMTLVSSIQSKANFGNFIYFFACLFAPIIVLLGFALIQSLISVVASFFSFIKISPNGLEQKHLLDKHIRCTWSDVDRLGKYFLFYDVIYR